MILVRKALGLPLERVPIVLPGNEPQNDATARAVGRKFYGAQFAGLA
jgi:hypothetical protein